MTVAGAFIVAAKRTPFGAFGGAFKSISAVQLGVVATEAALKDGGDNLSAELVDSCYYGNVVPAGNDAAYLARHIALKSGCANSTTALTLNRLCGSGFESVRQACQAIALGEAEVCIAGGTEQMSQAPLVADGLASRWGVKLGTGLQLRDSLWDGLTDAHANMAMGATAEKLAQQYNITREDCDIYAVRSQFTWGEAHASNIFVPEIAPVKVPTSQNPDNVVDTDEHPRPATDVAKISKLKAVFQKNGVVTAANASGICDGAGTLIVASEKAVQRHNLKPLCRVVATAVTGCDPTIMGIGPVQAIRDVLKKADLSLHDMDLIEINEAFAAQFLSCAKELDLDLKKTNACGGAIALGHPLAASGARITAHLAHQFHNPNNKNNKYHIGAACIGGGQGIAVLLERA